jgi:hypothetical protein
MRAPVSRSVTSAEVAMRGNDAPGNRADHRVSAQPVRQPLALEREHLLEPDDVGIERPDHLQRRPAPERPAVPAVEGASVPDVERRDPHARVSRR